MPNKRLTKHPNKPLTSPDPPKIVLDFLLPLCYVSHSPHRGPEAQKKRLDFMWQVCYTGDTRREIPSALVSHNYITMALTWNITKCVDVDDLWHKPSEGDLNGPRQLKGFTETIIFATMTTGMNSITEGNWEKFASRIFMAMKTQGFPSFRQTDTDKPEKTETLSRDAVKWLVWRHIGLKTNASTLTEAQFRKNCWRVLGLRVGYGEGAEDREPLAEGAFRFDGDGVVPIELVELSDEVKELVGI